MTDLQARAGSLVKALRRAERYCLNEYSKMAGDAADLIETLSTENAEKKGFLEKWCSGEDQYQETVTQLDCAKSRITELKAQLADAADCIGQFREMLEEAERRGKDARNELCLKCGKYCESHNGSCDGCRWKED